MTGNFLVAEGLYYEWSVAEPGVSALNALEDGTAQVVQSTCQNLTQKIMSVHPV